MWGAGITPELNEALAAGTGSRFQKGYSRGRGDTEDLRQRCSIAASGGDGAARKPARVLSASVLFADGPSPARTRTRCEYLTVRARPSI